MSIGKCASCAPSATASAAVRIAAAWRLGSRPSPALTSAAAALIKPERANEAARHRPAGNREVLHRALGLRAPQRIGGNAQLAHAVVLDAVAALACGSGRSLRHRRRSCSRSAGAYARKRLNLRAPWPRTRLDDRRPAARPVPARWPLCGQGRRAAPDLLRVRADQGPREGGSRMAARAGRRSRASSNSRPSPPPRANACKRWPPTSPSPTPRA